MLEVVPVVRSTPMPVYCPATCNPLLKAVALISILKVEIGDVVATPTLVPSSKIWLVQILVAPVYLVRILFVPEQTVAEGVPSELFDSISFVLAL